MSSRRGVIIVFSLILLATAFSLGAVLILGAMFGAAAPPSVPAQTTLRLKLRAPFGEIEPLDIFSDYLEAPPTLRSTINMIHRAKADDRVKTLVILPEAGGGLWAQLQDVRAALLDFKKSGKPITAYLESAGTQEYYLASAADRIILMPAGTLDLTGLTTYEMFFRGALDKLGVYPDMLHIGDYKTYSNTFTEKGFTNAHREMTKSLNKDFYDEIVRAIAEGRKRSEAEVRQAIDDGPYLAEAAKRAGLVDSLAYDDQVDTEAPLKGTRRMEGEAYARASSLAPGLGAGPRVALLYAVGTIASGKSSFDGLGGAVVGSDTFAQWVKRVRLEPDIRAVIVRIDSPGGSAIASDVIWRELSLVRAANKPLIVSMGDVAASGGYYIAAPADAIVAEPGTITGSIGVVTGKFVLKEMFDKLGIGTDQVSDGRMAQLESPFRPFSKEERAKMDEQMQVTYDMFVSRVAEGRHTTAAKIDAIGKGRVWTGRQAREIGLVDELGGLDTALQLAKVKAHIDPKSSVQLVVYPPKRNLLDVIANPSGSYADARLASALTRPEFRLIETAAATLRLFRRGEALMLMPNAFWN
jgi:protease-4